MKEKSFYKRIIHIALPIMVQNGITNFVNMLDNIMVGQVGTNPMSGVAIVNNLLFVWNLCIFGGLSGIGIFTAQFAGRKNNDGIRHTFRLMVLTGVILTALGLGVFLLFGRQLISLYLHGSETANINETLLHGHRYLMIMLAGLLPFAAAQIYSTVLRETGETRIPMRASLIAVLVNLIGNYVLIYGKFGFPAMGVAGAAAATVISRCTELLFLAFVTHSDPERYPFIKDVYSSMSVPGTLAAECIRKASPLLLNETLWAAGQAVLSQTYSSRGLEVVAATNISATIGNVFNVSFIAMGSAIGIILGQELGAGHLDTVKKDANRLAVFAVLICAAAGAGLYSTSSLFPRMYNTSEEIRNIAAGLIRVSALCMPLYAYENASYFTVRSGGKTVITFLFDSCFSWLVVIPVAYVLTHMTAMDIVYVFLCVQLCSILKCLIGFILVQKGIWIHDLTGVLQQ